MTEYYVRTESGFTLAKADLYDEAAHQGIARLGDLAADPEDVVIWHNGRVVGVISVSAHRGAVITSLRGGMPETADVRPLRAG